MSPRRRQLLVFAAGAFALTAQTALLRELLVVFQGNALGTGVFFATWLLWVAAGAAVGSRWRVAEGALPWLALAMIPAAAVQLLGWHWARPLSGLGPADLVPLEVLVGLAALLNAPTSLLTGAIFPAAARAGSEEEATGLYAWEAAGCFLGGTGVTIALLAGLGPISALGLAAVGLAAVAGRRAAVASGLAGVIGLAAVVAGPRLEADLAAAQALRLLPGAEVLATRDTPAARWAVLSRGEAVVVLRDGAVLSTHPDPADAPAEVALAMAQARGPTRVLVLGQGVEEELREILSYGEVSRVDLVITDARGWSLLSPHLPPSAQAARDDPRVAVHRADPRAWLATTDGPWDLVWIASADPATPEAARLHTADMYAAARRVLAPGGVVATRVLSGENYLGTELAALGASALATLGAAFDHVALVPGDPTRLYASPARDVVTEDPATLRRRHARLDYRGAFPSEALEGLVDPERVRFAREALSRPDPTGGTLVSRDDRPLALALVLQVLARLSGGAGLGALSGARALGHTLWLVPLLLLLSLRAHLLWTRPAEEADGTRLSGLLVAAAGFTSLSLGVVLLYAFQVRAGTLFGTVGLASALLLAGLTAGAAAGRLLVARLDPPARRGVGRLPRAPLVALGASAAVCLALPPVLATLPHGPGAAPGLYALLALAGGATGLGFPAAASVRATGTPPAGPLFALDHLGAAAGAAVVGVVVAPLLSVTGAVALLAALQLGLAALLVIRARASGRHPVDRGERTWGRLPHFLVGLTATAVLLGGLAHHRLHRPTVDFDRVELASLAVAERYRALDAPFRHYQGEDHTGDLAAVVVASWAAGDAASGYAGPVNLRVVVDAEGTYQRVDLLEHEETPSYARPVATWLQGLVGRSATERLALVEDGGGVDGVTGSTLTARAVLTGLDTTGLAVAEEVLHLPVSPPPPRGPTRLDPAAPALAVALGLGVWVALRPGRRRRWALLAASVAVLGLWQNTGLSLESLAAPLRGVPPGLHNPAGLVLLAGVAACTLALGPVWCGHLCPLGAVQELLGSLGLTLQVSPATDRRLRGLKYLVLALVLTGFALSGSRAFLGWDPLAHAFARWPASWSLALLGGLLAGAAFVLRGWCRYLCPVGAMLSLANALPWVRRALPRRTARCDLGVRGRDLDCIQCGRCVLEPAPTRGPVAATSRPLADLPVVVGVVALLAIAGGAGLAARAADLTPGGARDIDEQLIQLLIEEGRLSDREADFWDPAD